MTNNDSLLSSIAKMMERINSQNSLASAANLGIAKAVAANNLNLGAFTFANDIAKSITVHTAFDFVNKINIGYVPTGLDTKLLQAITNQNSILNNINAFTKTLGVGESLAQQANTICKATNWLSNSFFGEALMKKNVIRNKR